MPKAKIKIEFTRKSLIQLGLSALLIILSIIFFIIGARRFILRLTYTSAVNAFYRGDLAAAEDKVKDMINLAPDFVYAREMLAKIKADAGVFEEAISQYQLLKDKWQRDSVYLGLGAVYLRQASQEKDKTKALELIEKARECYNKAKGLSDSAGSAIGLLYCDLLESLKKGQIAAQKKKLREEFEKIENDILNKRYRVPTIEELIDLYNALSFCASASFKTLKDKDYPRKVMDYMPFFAEEDKSWEITIHNFYIYEAIKTYYNELKDVQPSMLAANVRMLANDLLNKYANRPEIKNDSLMTYLLIWIWKASSRIGEFVQTEADAVYKNELPYILVVLYATIRKGNPLINDHKQYTDLILGLVSYFLDEYRKSKNIPEVKDILVSPELKTNRIHYLATLNNLAGYYYLDAIRKKIDTLEAEKSLTIAKEKLEEASKIIESQAEEKKYALGYYLTLRNLAVVYDKLKQTAQALEYFEKAKKYYNMISEKYMKDLGYEKAYYDKDHQELEKYFKEGHK